MGNSPSKKNPLPKTSTHNVPNTEISSEDSEPDEHSSALSQYQASMPIESTFASAKTNSNSSKTPPAHRRSSTKSASKPSSAKTLFAKPSKTPNKAIKSTTADLDLQIDLQMANLLPGHSPSSPSYTPFLDSPHSLPISTAIPRKEYPKEYGSSLDSDLLPVFTSMEYKDSDLLLLLGSYLSSPKTRSEYDEAIMLSLDPISESHENLPAPASPLAARDSVDVVTKKFSRASLSAKGSSRSSLSSGDSPSSADKSDKACPVDLDSVIERLIKAGKQLSRKSRRSKDKLVVSTDEIKYILRKSRSIFLSQPTLLRLAPPVKVVGDLHGQFSDLIRIFNNSGYPPFSNYLFLGDYVDRGYKSLETILLLLCYKVKYPENFFMLRGNHESANITKIYGFYDECKRRLPSLTGNHKVWKLFVDVFNTLPIAAIINEKIFCIHGGLSPDLDDMKQIEDIKRPTDVPDKGLLADLLWSDPDASVKTFSLKNWPKNDRGVSYCFGKKHVDHFCATFGFELIVRGHMVVEDGYEFFNKRKLVTIFSAPNYCGEFKNYGAVMSVDKALCCSFDLLKPV